jgi:phosphate transport system protein
MTKLLDLGINRINELLKNMTCLAEVTYVDSIDAYKNDNMLRKKIYRNSEKLRILQEEITELAIELIARYQPVATDLRFIKSSLEISYNISRFGRYSFDIVDLLEESGPLIDCDKSLVLEMSKTVMSMISICFNSILTQNVQALRELYELENNVDKQYRKYLREIIQSQKFSRYSHERKNNINCHLTSLLILRYLERISDHACSIADSINYIKSGKSSPRL